MSTLMSTLALTALVAVGATEVHGQHQEATEAVVSTHAAAQSTMLVDEGVVLHISALPERQLDARTPGCCDQGYESPRTLAASGCCDQGYETGRSRTPGFVALGLLLITAALYIYHQRAHQWT